MLGSRAETTQAIMGFVRLDSTASSTARPFRFMTKNQIPSTANPPITSDARAKVFGVPRQVAAKSLARPFLKNLGIALFRDRIFRRGFPDGVGRAIHEPEVHTRQVFANHSQREQLGPGKNRNHGSQKRKDRKSTRLNSSHL